VPEAGRSVLCVDNRASRNLALFLLRRAGYEVRAAGSVAEALRLARDGRFDLYLINQTTPGGRGRKCRCALARRGAARAVLDRPVAKRHGARA
jgi:CheY-like chemotaxis protein